MNRAIRISTLLLAGWLSCPLQPVLALGSALSAGPVPGDGLLARGGGGGRAGGGGGGFGGGSRGGGGGGGFSGRGQTGFQNAGGGFNRGDARPSGGWSNQLNSSAARPSLDRPASSGGSFNRDVSSNGNRFGGGSYTRPNGGTVGGAYGNRTGYGNRNINIAGGRQVNVNALNVSPGWARPGWGVARPWGNVGWYGGWARPPWGWWGASAAAWGIGTLASAAIINGAVNSAINSQSSYIVVPDTDFQLLYGTVSAVGNSGVSFAATINGTTLEMSADCQAGTLNNQTPSSAAAAQLLNAACQVAYGNA